MEESNSRDIKSRNLVQPPVQLCSSAIMAVSFMVLLVVLVVVGGGGCHGGGDVVLRHVVCCGLGWYGCGCCVGGAGAIFLLGVLQQ